MIKGLYRIAFIVALCGVLVGGLVLDLPASEARGTTWTVMVYNNPNLAASPIWTGVSPSVNYVWGQGAPVINGVSVPGAPIDNFSVRFTGSAFFTAGNYRFTVQVDDGARLTVDGLLLINQWVSGQGLRTFQADYTFAADGYHAIQVDYFDAIGDATIIVTWSLAVGGLPTATPFYSGIPWYGEFFTSNDLSGAPVFTGTYPPSGLNINWGAGSPGGAVPVDNFTARFTRTLTVPNDMPEAVYTVYGRADDNFRFYVDNAIIIDHWDSFAGDQNYTGQMTLLTGTHTLKFEYREQSANAFVFLTWTPPNAQNPPLDPNGSIAPATGQGGAVTGINATVNVSVLNFRNAPSTTGAILSKLNKGAVYPATGRTADNAWVQIQVDATSGWVVAQYVTLSGDINTLPVVNQPAAAPTAVPQPIGVRGRTYGNLRVREAPTTSSKQIELMPWGTEMDLLGTNGTRTWYMVSYNGVIGWAYAPWIRFIEGTIDQLPFMDGTRPSVQPPAPTQGVIAQAYGNMRIRSGPGFNFPKIGKALWGSRVQVLGRSTNGLWYKIQHGDVIGWSYAAWYRIVQGEITTVPVGDQ